MHHLEGRNRRDLETLGAHHDLGDGVFAPAGEREVPADLLPALPTEHLHRARN